MKPRKLTTTLDWILASPGVHIWAFRDELPGTTSTKKAIALLYRRLKRESNAHVSVSCRARILVNPNEPYDSEPCLQITVSHDTL
jgi:hypothetical protein